MNADTNFDGDPLKSGLIFEDGVRCCYSDALTKGKILECALIIADQIASLDYQIQRNEKNEILTNPELLAAQETCVEKIVNVIDMIHLVHEGINKERFCSTDVGKLAYYG